MKPEAAVPYMVVCTGWKKSIQTLILLSKVENKQSLFKTKRFNKKINKVYLK